MVVGRPFVCSTALAEAEGYQRFLIHLVCAMQPDSSHANIVSIREPSEDHSTPRDLPPLARGDIPNHMPGRTLALMPK